jgi:hypothetical protein
LPVNFHWTLLTSIPENKSILHALFIRPSAFKKHKLRSGFQSFSVCLTRGFRGSPKTSHVGTSHLREARADPHLIRHFVNIFQGWRIRCIWYFVSERSSHRASLDSSVRQILSRLAYPPCAKAATRLHSLKVLHLATKRVPESSERHPAHW